MKAKLPKRQCSNSTATYTCKKPAIANSAYCYNCAWIKGNPDQKTIAEAKK